MPNGGQENQIASWKVFGLTALERQALALTVAGYSNAESAQRLGTTEKACRLHLVKIYKKLRVSNRLELVLFALYHDLVGTPPVFPSGRTSAVRSKTRTNSPGV